MHKSLGIVAGNVISSSFSQSYTPQELFSRVNATSNVFNYGAIPVGALLAGAIATRLGIREAMWMMTALLPLTSLFLLASPLRRLRDLPASGPASDRGRSSDGSGGLSAAAL